MTVHDPRKIGRLAREHFSSALMSDTKWRKLLTAIATAGLPLNHATVKFIDVVEPRVLRFPPSLDCHPAYMDTIEFGPVELRAIEWLDFPVDIEAVARPLGRFPLEIIAGGMRVVGYRP
ncbi:MAG: hypothetical protein JO276_09685 [Sphingomonadaceae bacterium]|nr:hypothetical protein [Sphingomonadaceae bacterium]